MSRCFLLLAALGGLSASATAPAEPFAIDFEVRSGKASKTAHAVSTAPDLSDDPPRAREALEIKAGDRVTVQWTIRGTDPKDKDPDITVHFFAVKEEAAGQKAVPKLDKSVVAESAATLDIGPGDKSEGELTFTIEHPGDYLLRVETIGGVGGPAGHDDCAALDVKAR